MAGEGKQELLLLFVYVRRRQEVEVMLVVDGLQDRRRRSGGFCRVSKAVSGLLTVNATVRVAMRFNCK
jgi:hypothetical protein